MHQRHNQAFSPRLLVLIDGRQVYADYYGFTVWSALPVELSAIRQIEVIKGPNTALFGFNAVGGVINIITYNPLYDSVNTASVTGGTQSLVQGSVVGTSKLGDAAAVRISASGRSNDDFSTPIPAALAGSRRARDNQGAVDIDGIAQLGPKVQLSIEASHASSAVNVISPVYTFIQSQYTADSLKAQLNADTGFGLVQAIAYTNWNTEYDTPGSFNQPFYFSNQVSVVQLQDIFKLGNNHTVRATVEYRHNSESTTPTGGAHVTYDVFAVGGMWNWEITPTVSLTNALRVDRLSLGRDGFVPPGYPFTNASWNRSFAELSFNSGVVWKVDELNTLRLTASRGVQIPSLTFFGGFLQVNPSSNSSGVPTLNPTIVMNYELGWDRALPWLNGQFRASAFYEHTRDITSIEGGFIPTAGVPYFTQANVGSSDGEGLELGLKGQFLANWRWGVNYRAEVITDHFKPFAQGGVDFVDFQHVTPVHVVNAKLGWASGRWEVDGYLRYVSHAFGLLPSGPASTVLVPIADYVSVDGRIGYKLTERVTLSLSGQNITQSTQRQTVAPNVERRVFGILSIKF